MLILGLGDNKHPTTLTMTIQQKIVLGVSFYYYIFVGIIVFISVLLTISGLIWIVRRRNIGGLFGIVYSI